MANRTVNRTVFSVPIRSNKDGFFKHTQFKGICDKKNNITIDQETFIDTDNIYVDDNNQLSSRPAIKFESSVNHIIDQWVFGNIRLRLRKVITETTADYVMTCISHTAVSDEENGKYDEWSWPIEKGVTLKYKLIQKENRIYIWLLNTFICFNTAGYYFEEAKGFIYAPINKLIINGIESDLESKNFLSSRYIKRYQYSVLSQVNFEKLIGKTLKVKFNGKDLYEITMQKNQEKLLLYPYSPIGNNYFIDVVQTNFGNIIMRYTYILNQIEVSFDGKYFRPLPTLENIMGYPKITKDGLYIVAFTQIGVAQCKIVASETTDFLEPENVLSWTVNAYMRKEIAPLTSIDNNFIPDGYFETIDLFAYIFQSVTGEQYLYTEWLSGASVIHGYTTLTTKYYEGDANEVSVKLLRNDDFKVYIKYVAPTTEYENPPVVISILSDSVNDYYYNTSLSLLQVVELKTQLINYYLTISGETALFTNQFIDLSFTPEVGYTGESFGNIVKYMDAITLEPIMDSIGIIFNFVILYSLKADDKFFDCITIVNYNYTTENINSTTNTLISENSFYFKLFSDKEFITNNYLYSNNSVINLPDNYELAKIVVDENREVSNADNISVLPGYNANIFKLSDDGLLLDGSQIEAGDLVSFTPKAKSPKDFLQPKNLGVTTAELLAGPTVDSEDFRGIAFGNNTYVAIKNGGSTGDIYTSSDGINWTAGNSPSAWYKTEVVYGNSLFVCLLIAPTDETDNKVMTSPDGINWTERTISAFDEIITWTSICWSGSLFVAVGYNEADDTAKVMTSSNGTTWTARTTAIDAYWRKVIYANGLFVAVGDRLSAATSIMTSTNGTTWVQRETDRDYDLTDICYGNGLFVAVAALGHEYGTDKIFISLDGITWSNISIGHYDYNFKRIIYGNGLFIAISKGAGSNSFIWQSLDGITWNMIWVSDTSSEYYQLTFGDWRVGLYNDNKFILLGKRTRVISMVEYTYYQGIINYELNSNRYIITKADETEGLIMPGDSIELTPYDEDISLPVGNLGNSNNDIIVIIASSGEPIEGTVQINKKFLPLSIHSKGIWYNIDGTLWTSEINSENIIMLDELLNGDNFSGEIPDYHATLNEEYLSFVTSNNENLLQVTEDRRNDSGDFMWYLPKSNEQKFSKKITNLHVLSENEMGVFTSDEIWYVKPVQISNTIAYTKPMKSKIPLGCKDGNDILTAIDGKAILLSTQRGIAAMSPQDFIATAEQTLTYMSDNIDTIYKPIYNNYNIKMVNFNSFILFYEYLGRQILIFDTTTNYWWKWTTQYPIKNIAFADELYILMQVDYLTSSLDCLSFVLDEDAEEYKDDIIANTLNGDTEIVYENQYVGNRTVKKYADEVIKWYINSQKLHFDEINNYKLIKALNIVATGDEIQTAKITTKVYRDCLHPENSDVKELRINDLKTFIYRMNFMHVINFQYKLETDLENDNQYPLKINSFSIKYELKERLR